jgi:hypothetical protein
VLEVDRHKREIQRDRDTRGGKPRALPRLRGRVIDLEEPHCRCGIGSICIGIEARAQHDDLLHTALERDVDRVLGKTAACGDEEPHPAAMGPAPSFLAENSAVSAEDRNGEWVREDATAIENLMGRSM